MFWHRKHSVIVRKIKWFGLKCLFCLLQKQLEVSLKTLACVATNMVGYCPVHCWNNMVPGLKYPVVWPLQMLKRGHKLQSAIWQPCLLQLHRQPENLFKKILWLWDTRKGTGSPQMPTDFCSTDSTERLLYIDKHHFAIKNDRYSKRIKAKIVPTPVPTCRYCETYFRRHSSCDFDLEKQLLHKSNVLLFFFHFILILRENCSLHITNQVF